MGYVQNNKNLILLFDGECNLCNSTVQFVIKRDKLNRFSFATLQSKTGQQILKNHSLSQSGFDSFILMENNNLHQKSTVALKVAKKLGGGWKLFYIFIIVPKFIRDFVYSLIAINRYKIFGKSSKCMIPTPELKEKFLD